ncbi:unnamed protein product [Coccothraustes coccothraustes]
MSPSPQAGPDRGRRRPPRGRGRQRARGESREVREQGVESGESRERRGRLSEIAQELLSPACRRQTREGAAGPRPPCCGAARGPRPAVAETEATAASAPRRSMTSWNYRIV